MKVRDKKASSPARAANIAPPPVAQVYSFPAPTRGWVQDENLAAVAPGAAYQLDNWICTTTGVRVRGGTEKYATVAASNGVQSMFTYLSGSVEKFFAASTTDVYEITTVADADVIPSAAISAQTSGYYTSQMFTTAGGEYMYIVNGDDAPQLYDGTTWTAITGVSTPAITGVTTSDLSHVWTYANRLFFIERDTLSAWYLPVDSIGGAATEVSLAGVFKKGGSLLFGATWSMDAGDGLDDKCVFVTTQGEVAVYEGIDPSSASTWRLAGIYQIAPPLGKNATMRAGGDLLIATQAGLVPMSEAVNKDKAALELAAVSRPIDPYWTRSVAFYGLPWEVQKWSDQNILVIASASTSDDGSTLVCNLQTGAWSRLTNIGCRCVGLFDGYVYVGGNDGTVRKMESGGSDAGDNYTAVYVGAHERMGDPGATKTVTQARAVFRAWSAIAPLVSAQTDYTVGLSPAPGSLVSGESFAWDVGLWDLSVWGGPANSVVTRWRSVGRTGHAIAPEVQLTFGNQTTPRVELVATDVTYTIGGMVT